MPRPIQSFFTTTIALTLFALANGYALAQSHVECNSVQSKILSSSVRYCVLLPPGYDSPDSQSKKGASAAKRYPVLYYLHGLGDNEQSLVNSGAIHLVDDLREQHKIGDFLIVTPEGDQTFYINSQDGKTRYGDFFLHEFIPFIESHYRIRSRLSSRGIMGISMGGYGALHFAFANPQLFGSVSAQSPALMPESPEGLDVAINSGYRQASVLGDVFGNPINVRFWRENSPFVLARRNAAALRKLQIYFDCGTEDDYGFDKGARALHKELLQEKIPHEFHLYPGGHNLVFFLQHFGASVEFHSRAFSVAH